MTASHVWHLLGSLPVATRVALAVLAVVVPDGVWSLANRVGRAVAWLDARLVFRSPVVRRYPEPVHCWHDDGSHDTDWPAAPDRALDCRIVIDEDEPVPFLPADPGELLSDAFDLAEEVRQDPAPLEHRLPGRSLLESMAATDLFAEPSAAEIDRAVEDLIVHTWRESDRLFGGAS